MVRTPREAAMWLIGCEGGPEDTDGDGAVKFSTTTAAWRFALVSMVAMLLYRLVMVIVWPDGPPNPPTLPYNWLVDWMPGWLVFWGVIPLAGLMAASSVAASIGIRDGERVIISDLGATLVTVIVTAALASGLTAWMYSTDFNGPLFPLGIVLLLVCGIMVLVRALFTWKAHIGFIFSINMLILSISYITVLGVALGSIQYATSTVIIWFYYPLSILIGAGIRHVVKFLREGRMPAIAD